MDAVLVAVLNALWQGAALIAFVAFALRAGLRRNATTACVVWMLAFAIVALLPAIDLAIARPAKLDVTPAFDRAQFSVRVAGSAASHRRVERRAPRVFFAPPTRQHAIVSIGASLAQRVGENAQRLGRTTTAFARAWGLAIAGVWALVATALLLRLGGAYAAVARVKREATPIDDPTIAARLRAAGHRRRATVARSRLVEIPCAIGFRTPMILIPAHLADTLDSDDLARVVLHESAHLQRYDDWVNALEQVVCALQFFQPALHFARRSIDFEREVACDDRVLEDAGEPLRYAECLARIVHQVRGRQAAVVPGFVLRRTQVLTRVRRIVDRSRDASPHLRLGAAVLGGGVLIATFGIARLQVPLVAPAAASLAQAPANVPHAARQTSITQAASTAPVRHVARTANTTVRQNTKRAETVIAAAGYPSPSPTSAATPSPSPAATPSPSPTPSPTPYARAVHQADHQPVHETIHREIRTMVHVEPSVAGEPVVAPRAMTVNVDVSAIAPAVSPGTTIVVVPRLSHDGGDLLDAIDEAKYPHPSVDELIAMRTQGITGDYVRKMGALGRGRPSVRELIGLAVQGVTPEYVATLDARLATRPTLDEVLSLRIQGVRGSWLDGLAAIGYPKLSASEAAALSGQGVTVAYVRGLVEAGMRILTPAQLVALRVQSVDGTFVRRLADHGYRNLTVDDLVRLKVSGFEP